jgi:hypothetical protein
MDLFPTFRPGIISMDRESPDMKAALTPPQKGIQYD